MSASGDVGVQLAKVLAKTACTLLFPIPAVGVGVGELAAWYIEHAATSRERRTLKHIVADLEQIAEDVAKKTLDQFGYEFRSLPEHERNAAILAVGDTFSRNPVTRDVAMNINMSGVDLAEFLRNVDAANIRKIQLSADAQELYNLVLLQTCTDLMTAVGPLPEIQLAAMSETLLRLQEIINDLADVPEQVFARVRSGNDPQFTLDYNSWVARTLNLIDPYCGLVRGRPETVPLEYVYISPPATANAELYSTVEQALAGRSLVFLTGDRGSGKTSVLRRIAVLAGRRGFPHPLDSWNGRIPFFVPLRRHDEFPMPDGYLRHINFPYSGNAPEGWMSSLISEGKALILMNGLDEVPYNRRMSELPQLADFADFAGEKGNIVVVSSRRGAVPDQWAEGAGFCVVDIESPGPADIVELTTRWHEAVGMTLRDPEQRDRVAGHRDVLLSSLRHRSDLRALASNPLSACLMCAICIEDRVGLPDQWSRLIDEVASALAERDQGRSIPQPAAISLPNITALERELASWAARNSRWSMERSEILPAVTRALGRLGRSSVSGESALNDVAVRGSVFGVRPDGHLGPVSDVLYAHMAAGELAADNDLGLVTNLAKADGWQRLVLATLRRLKATDAIALLSELVGTQESRGEVTDDRETLLALAGIPPSRDGKAEEAVEALAQQRAQGLVPPEEDAAVARLAVQGDLALDVLSTVVAGSLAETPEPIALAILRTALDVARVGNSSALLFVARFAEDPRPAIQEQLWAAWPAFDRIEYARAVLRLCVVERSEVTVDDPSVLEAVAFLDFVQVLNTIEGQSVDLSPLRGRSDLTVVVPTADNVLGAELLGTGSTVVVRPQVEESGL